jgi:MFS transporter, SP family, galactose:H+ symporter
MNGTSEPKPLAAGRGRLAGAVALLLLVLAVILMAGLLFGYDQGVISGALDGIQRTFRLSPLLIEVVVSWVTLGALFGSLVAGDLADRIGRKKTVVAAGALFVVGALIQALSPSAAELVFGRLTVGLGVGVAAVAAPLYGAEMAPAAWRGRFVSAYQLAITLGIFFAYLVDARLAAKADWRLMLGASAVPGALLVLVVIGAPESPRWLMKQGRRAEAAEIVKRLQPGVDHRSELDAIGDALRADAHAASWGEVFAPTWRRPLVIALGLAVFQQVTGINAIIYYSDTIFAGVGFSTPQAQTAATTWAIGFVNVAATLIAIAFIDRFGRRPLLLIGLVGMGLSLTAVGVAASLYSPHAAARASTAGLVTLVALVGFISSFAFSLGPVVWTVINEVFPSRIRGRAVAVATAVNWGSAFLVSEFTLSLTRAVGAPMTFWLFALCCLIAWIWIYRAVPETKGHTLEEIQQLWTAPAQPGR